MNNLQALQNLEKFAEKKKQEQKSITEEIMKKNLEDLNTSLKNSLALSLNSIEKQSEQLMSDYEKKLNNLFREIEKKAYNLEPMKFKLSSLAMSFLVGMLTMIILLAIAWYLWIKPYQISKELTTTDSSGKVYLYIEKNRVGQQGNFYYLPLN
ncbi:hypothetical protein SBK71_08855 (plasmid) [Campylobacter coli]